MKEKLIRIAPILLIIAIAILSIITVVTVVNAFMNGGNNNQSQQAGDDSSKEEDKSVKDLLSVEQNRSVKMAVRGPIVAQENFRSYTVEVSPTYRKLITYKGYLDEVIKEVNLGNNSESYTQFVNALNKANMMKGVAFSGAADDLAGVCATGHLYDFKICLFRRFREMSKLCAILELMRTNAKVLFFDCFGVLVLRQPSSERIFEYVWKKDKNLLNFIRQQKANGLKIGIISNVAQYQFDEFFSRKEQAELFDFLVLSGEVGCAKPNSRIFKIAIEKSNVLPSEIAFFDDSILNVEAAQKVGIQGFLYKNWEDFSEEFKED